MDVPEPRQLESTTRIQFEVLNIRPIKLNMSFISTDWLALESDTSMAQSSNNPIAFIARIMTSTIANISVSENAMAAYMRVVYH